MDKNITKLIITPEIFKDFLDILHKENSELPTGDIWFTHFIAENGNLNNQGNLNYTIDILDDTRYLDRLFNMINFFTNHKLSWIKTPYDGDVWNSPMIYVRNHCSIESLLDKLTYLCSENKLDETFIPINI